MSRWWDDAQGAPGVVDSVVGRDDEVAVGAALLGLHAAGASVLRDLSQRTAVDAPAVREALSGVDYGSVGSVLGDSFDGARSAAEAGAMDVVSHLTSSGVPWPLALSRAAAGFGLPPGEARVYAGRVADKAIAPAVLADAADVALGAWASKASQVSGTKVSKAVTEDYIEVVIGNKRYRRKVLRDEEGQFAEQGDAGSSPDVAVRQEQAFDPAKKLPQHEFMRLSSEQKKAYLKAQRSKRAKRNAVVGRRREQQRERVKQAAEARVDARAAQAQALRDATKVKAPRLAANTREKVAVPNAKQAKKEALKQRRKSALKAKRRESLRLSRSEQIALRQKAMDTSVTAGDKSIDFLDAFVTGWPVGYGGENLPPREQEGVRQTQKRMVAALADYLNTYYDAVRKSNKTDSAGKKLVELKTADAQVLDIRQTVPEGAAYLRTDLYGLIALARAADNAEDYGPGTNMDVTLFNLLGTDAVSGAVGLIDTNGAMMVDPTTTGDPRMVNVGTKRRVSAPHVFITRDNSPLPLIEPPVGLSTSGGMVTGQSVMFNIPLTEVSYLQGSGVATSSKNSRLFGGSKPGAVLLPFSISWTPDNVRNFSALKEFVLDLTSDEKFRPAGFRDLYGTQPNGLDVMSSEWVREGGGGLSVMSDWWEGATKTLKDEPFSLSVTDMNGRTRKYTDGFNLQKIRDEQQWKFDSVDGKRVFDEDAFQTAVLNAFEQTDFFRETGMSRYEDLMDVWNISEETLLEWIEEFADNTGANPVALDLYSASEMTTNVLKAAVEFQNATNQVGDSADLSGFRLETTQDEYLTYGKDLDELISMLSEQGGEEVADVMFRLAAAVRSESGD